MKTPGGGRGRHRAVLAATRGRWLVRPPERAHLGGHPRAPGAPAAARPVPHRARGARARGALRDRELLAHPCRRRPLAWRARRRPGGQPPHGPLADVPLRGAPLARRGHRRRRRGGRQPPAAERRPGPGLPSPRPGRVPASTGLGSRRAGHGRDVELELGDRLAAGPQRPPDRHDPCPGRWTRPRMAGRPDHGPPPATPHGATRT
jgi:hypothetical protein